MHFFVDFYRLTVYNKSRKQQKEMKDDRKRSFGISNIRKPNN